jgi:hypothetical protein
VITSSALFCGAQASSANVSVRRAFSHTSNENKFVAIALLPIIVKIMQGVVYHIWALLYGYKSLYGSNTLHVIIDSLSLIRYCIPLLLAFVVKNKATKIVLLVVGIALALLKLWDIVI